jgi:hypothetical protein
MHPSELGQWYYLIYLLPGGVALLLLLLSSLSGGGRHHRVAGGHGRHLGGGRAGGRSGVRHHAARGTRGKEGTGANVAQQILTYFGVGRLPGPFVWGSALLGWGFFGFWGTRLWEASLHHPALFVLPALVTALVGSLAVTKLTAEVGGRLMPQTESYAISAVDLCGQTGTVAYPIDALRGRVNVYDAYGTLHTPSARTAPGGAMIGRGAKIIVTDYDAAHDQVIVEELPS